ncbi:DUF551 domain-containing protein [Pantoea ananatis]|uniref:DUF551 domain-containing protein n=1 Tax=Pantoea ananas TaxID=553 RepID=UPI001B30983B|nr:DUF551 domain-containing protein [Pantoea ananatis]
MTTNSLNPVDGGVQALIEWLKPQISELENICDELPFGLDEDDAMQLKVMRFALERLNATAQPVSDGWVKCSDRYPNIGDEVLIRIPVCGSHNIENGKYKGEGKFIGAWCDNRGEGCAYAVTEWMPLPAAPGGQDD